MVFLFQQIKKEIKPHQSALCTATPRSLRYVSFYHETLIHFPATVNTPDPLGVTEHHPYLGGQADYWGLCHAFPFTFYSAPPELDKDFISGTKVDKGRAKHFGASTLKLEPLHMCRKISALVNTLFPCLHSVTGAQFFWIHVESSWYGTRKKLYIH